MALGKLYLSAGLLAGAVWIRIVPTPVPGRLALSVGIGLLGVLGLAVALADSLPTSRACGRHFPDAFGTGPATGSDASRVPIGIAG